MSTMASCWINLKKNSDWSISRIVDRQEDESLDRIGLNKETSFFRTLFSPISFQEISFVDLWNSKGFKLIECSQSGNNVSIQFTYVAEKEIDPTTNNPINKLSDQIQSGRVVLDASNNFLPLEVFTERENPSSERRSKSTTKYHYDGSSPSLGEYSLPVRSETKFQYSPKLESTSSVVYEWNLSEKQEYEDFTLTAFGLIEPDWILSRNRNWLPIVFASLAVVLVSIGFYFLKSSS